MKNKVICLILALSLLTIGCGTAADTANTPSETPVDSTASENDQSKEETKTEETAEVTVSSVKSSLLGDEDEVYYDTALVPSVEPYSVNADFSNVVYDPYFSYYFDLENQNEYNDVKALREGLIKNNFVVVRSTENEFFDIYESNRYDMFPSFITVDSLMHTYHLYFAYLMETTEKDYLAGTLQNLSAYMLDKTNRQYQELFGTDWEEAALRNLEFFYVAGLLQDSTISAPIELQEFDDVAKAEYDKIMDAEGIDECAITGVFEDYSQYKPRGYYDGNEVLEKYFRSMMWYGRIPFTLDSDEALKSAVLMCLAISEKPEDWNSIYSITSFFAGASDDPGYEEMNGLLQEAYGSVSSVKDLASDTNAFGKLKELVKDLKLPMINSIPVKEGENPVIPSFRFMGQRFTIDEAIMQRLVYSSVEENGSGERRYLPDTLDVAAALGSETALDILKEQGDTEYKNYSDNLYLAKEHFNNSDPSLWKASLYAGWLNILRPLFEEKGEGYPSFMTNNEWTKKNLETFAGSYAELKHDTILYAKQLMAEMGGGEEEIRDDRGYVDPEPEVYNRFINLSNKTKEGLEALGMISDSQKTDLERLTEIAKNLLSISEKELKNEALSDDDYEFIRCYGGDLEHFWQEVNKDKYDFSLTYSYQASCPVVADIATDPNGAVLEVASGKAHCIYVVFPIDGELHIGRGSCYSFYQFESSMSDRLTDKEWKDRLDGGYLDDDWNWVKTEAAPEQPEWTNSYRIKLY